MSDANDQPILRLADGRLVYRGGRVVEPAVGYSPDASSGVVIDAANLSAHQQVPPATDARAFEVHTRRHLKDIPDSIRNANACAVVIAYKLFGLDDFEITMALNITEEQLERIRDSETHEFMHNAIVRSVLDAETDNVRDVFRQHAKTAASVLVDTLYNGTRGERTSAAKDFLDRSGHRPVDIVEHRHRMEGGLVIEVVKKNRDEHAPVIDVGVGDDNS